MYVPSSVMDRVCPSATSIVLASDVSGLCSMSRSEYHLSLDVSCSPAASFPPAAPSVTSEASDVSESAVLSDTVVVSAAFEELAA